MILRIILYRKPKREYQTPVEMAMSSNPIDVRTSFLIRHDLVERQLISAANVDDTLRFWDDLDSIEHGLALEYEDRTWTPEIDVRQAALFIMRREVWNFLRERRRRS